ncbi:hypothetical protein IAI51_00175 [Pseudomonas sp. N40(2020)]|uniref:hypothetical protein n=1 Tax=Pseudomonas sp. N40(2020) TaxID=2767798 RepID=UPI001656E4AC|nr:hypothetical protein [Pseudomonas sp. N40(2020)]MBC8994950.1 hypothetical protein [Pseudomonas sp. N40(2020)]
MSALLCCFQSAPCGTDERCNNIANEAKGANFSEIRDLTVIDAIAEASAKLTYPVSEIGSNRQGIDQICALIDTEKVGVTRSE